MINIHWESLKICCSVAGWNIRNVFDRTLKEGSLGRIFERHTNLGLGYQGAFSITQRREGQAEFQLSITLTKIEKERGRKDILKGIPHSSENNFLKVIWFQRSPAKTQRSNKTLQVPFFKRASAMRLLSHLIFEDPNTSSIVFFLQGAPAVKIGDSTLQHFFVWNPFSHSAASRWKRILLLASAKV